MALLVNDYHLVLVRFSEFREDFKVWQDSVVESYVKKHQEILVDAKTAEMFQLYDLELGDYAAGLTYLLRLIAYRLAFVLGHEYDLNVSLSPCGDGYILAPVGK